MRDPTIVSKMLHAEDKAAIQTLQVGMRVTVSGLSWQGTIREKKETRVRVEMDDGKKYLANARGVHPVEKEAAIRHFDAGKEAVMDTLKQAGYRTEF